jgi:hypothetical protein
MKRNVATTEIGMVSAMIPHQDREDPTNPRCRPDHLDGGGDIGREVGQGFDVEVRRHLFPQLLEPLLNRLGNRHRIRGSLAMEIDFHDLTAAESGDLVAVAMPAKDAGHVLHPDPAGWCFPHHRAANLLQVLEFVHGADEVDCIEIAKGAAGLIDVLLPQGDCEVGRCQAERREAILIGLDDNLRVKPTADLGGCNSDHRLEPRFEPAVGELAQLVEIAVTVKTEPHDGLEGRIEAEDAGDLRLARQLDQPEAFANIEAGCVHRLAPLELEDDFGARGARL